MNESNFTPPLLFFETAVRNDIFANSTHAFAEFKWRTLCVVSNAIKEMMQSPSLNQMSQILLNLDAFCFEYFEHYLTQHYPDWKSDYESQLQAILKAGASQKAGKTQRSSNTIALSDFIGIWHNQTGRTDPLVDALRTMLTNDRSYFEKLVLSDSKVN